MSVISLAKNEGINLSKHAPSLKRIRAELGWNPKTGNGPEYDLDVSVFVLRKAQNGEKNNMLVSDKHFVFYNNKATPSGSVVHSGDDRTGNGASDVKETITLDLTRFKPDEIEASIVVTIHDAVSRGQSFGSVKNSFIRLVDDETNKAVAEYRLTDEYKKETAVQVGSLYLDDAKNWNFQSIGAGYEMDLLAFVNRYGQQATR